MFSLFTFSISKSYAAGADKLFGEIYDKNKEFSLNFHMINRIFNIFSGTLREISVN